MRGHAAFIIPPGTKGCEQGAKVKKHGIRASHTADVHLDDVRVPGSCLLGGKEKLDELAKVREGKQSRARPRCGPSSSRGRRSRRRQSGSRAAAYEYALDYAKEREAFGRKIIENQSIAFNLADMKLEIDAARLADAPSGVDGQGRQGLRQRRGLDVEAEGRRGRRLGDRAGDPDLRAATATRGSSPSSACTAT